MIDQILNANNVFYIKKGNNIFVYYMNQIFLIVKIDVAFSQYQNLTNYAMSLNIDLQTENFYKVNISISEFLKNTKTFRDVRKERLKNLLEQL